MCVNKGISDEKYLSWMTNHTFDIIVENNICNAIIPNTQVVEFLNEV